MIHCFKKQKCLKNIYGCRNRLEIPSGTNPLRERPFGTIHAAQLPPMKTVWKTGGAQTLRHNHSAQPPGGDRSGRPLGANPYGNAPIGATIQHNRNISIANIDQRVNYNSLYLKSNKIPILHYVWSSSEIQIMPLVQVWGKTCRGHIRICPFLPAGHESWS